MLPPGEIEKVRADIERLEEARYECADSGIRKLVEAGIEEQGSGLLRILAGRSVTGEFQSLLTTLSPLARLGGPGQRVKKSKTVQN